MSRRGEEAQSWMGGKPGQAYSTVAHGGELVGSV